MQDPQSSNAKISSTWEEPMTVHAPWPLPQYTFDESLTEDENFLTYVLILARFSVSKKGHMGAMLVQPHSDGRYDQVLNPEAAQQRFQAEHVKSRIVAYANNTPILSHRNPKAVPEIHAEALCISQAARFGRPTDGCTAYVTFPPCNDCFKLLVACGVKRCVYRKCIRYPVGEAVLGSALVHDVEMIGTLKQRRQDVLEEEYLAHLDEEKRTDHAREQRCKDTWKRIDESANQTRDRDSKWWSDFMERHKRASQSLKKIYGNASNEKGSSSNKGGGKPGGSNRPKNSAQYTKSLDQKEAPSEEHDIGKDHASTTNPAGNIATSRDSRERSQPQRSHPHEQGKGEPGSIGDDLPIEQTRHGTTESGGQDGGRGPVTHTEHDDDDDDDDYNDRPKRQLDDSHQHTQGAEKRSRQH